eukprot:CAMPEP_0119013724 /NCGR_PEP_ID=MMETSP1176-20130426/8839_1 /TAXON_ID=265551 /ORGANISM="Synedropsis recta cf, Strain CCMP1620" /LENGTH=238 /DNA_ID=CAMNT_0006966835 /DNA_START=161 /DNA_END=877 /DNA_ORIENTATION=+
MVMLLRTAFLWSIVVGSVLGDEDIWEYEEPNWWDQIKSAKGHSKLRRCVKREIPPVQGETCRKGKLCYFGDQSCDDSSNSSHPNLKCRCVHDVELGDAWGSWACKPENCPICPLEPAAATAPGATCSYEGLMCNYGEDHCCGDTTPATSCTCTAEGVFDCFISDGCILPTCLVSNWRRLIGDTCEDATDEVRDSYPGLIIKCMTGEALPDIPDGEENLSRMYMLLDSDGLVVDAPRVG